MEYWLILPCPKYVWPSDQHKMRDSSVLYQQHDDYCHALVGSRLLNENQFIRNLSINCFRMLPLMSTVCQCRVTGDIHDNNVYFHWQLVCRNADEHQGNSRLLTTSPSAKVDVLRTEVLWNICFAIVSSSDNPLLIVPLGTSYMN